MLYIIIYNERKPINLEDNERPMPNIILFL